MPETLPAAARDVVGVRDANAGFEVSRVWAVHDPLTVDPQRTMAAIPELGYTPTAKRAGS